MSVGGAMWSESEEIALLRLGDLLIAGGAGMPRASDTGEFLRGCERVCGIRPDLIETVKRIISDLDPTGAWTVDSVRAQFPAEFPELGELVAGAYFLDPLVMSRLEYLGRPTIPLDEEAVRIAEMSKIVAPVVSRGNIFRTTPQRD